ncbi:MAG: hypothetical protein MJ189_02760, partial [Coriobacteriales bacterium]|nr:hypothetical protein [Coriobacteriales bacterium]
MSMSAAAGLYQSLVGFVLVNLRTKDTRYYTCSGATESSAMSSAEGQVQQMKYKATSPLLLNIADRPTYFLSLKDDAGLVKMYAYIDVQQYQIVGTGSTVADAQKNYVMALASSSDVKIDSAKLSGVADKDSFIEAEITDIQSVVIDGNTYFYLTLKDKVTIYTCPATLNARLPFLKAGNSIKISTSAEKDGVAEISTLEVL